MEKSICYSCSCYRQHYYIKAGKLLAAGCAHCRKRRIKQSEEPIIVYVDYIAKDCQAEKNILSQKLREVVSEIGKRLNEVLQIWDCTEQDEV